MRIYFGIYEWSVIKWPNGCLYCGTNADKLLKVRKRTIYDIQYRILWFSILSRVAALYYPVCKRHHFWGCLLRYTSKWGFLLLTVIAFLAETLITNAIIIPYVSLTLLSLFIVSFIYVRKNALIIYRVNKDYTEISLPDGKYAEDFGLLNQCNKINGYLLMQEIELEEITDSKGYFGEERILCADESCIGIIEKGRCTVCGKGVSR